MRDQGTARLVAQGDAATAAGLDPRVGDVVRVIGQESYCVSMVDNQTVFVGWDDASFSREEWAKLCEAHGYLIERGGVSDG